MTKLTWVLVGLCMALVFACDMPWDANDQTAPPAPEVTQFIVSYEDAYAIHEHMQHYPRVTISYEQNDNPRVEFERSAPHDNHPGFVGIGGMWHGNPLIDSGLHLPDNRLTWGHQYVYRLKGYDGDGGPSEASREFTLNMPNHHPPNNVQIDRNAENDVVSWSRTAVDDGSGKTTYSVYCRVDGSDYGTASNGSNLTGTTFTHYHSGETYEYRVRAWHDDYGWTRGSGVGDQWGSLPGLPGDGDNGSGDDDVVAGDNELVYRGEQVSLSQLWFDWSYPHGSDTVISIASSGIDVEAGHTGSGGYVYLVVHPSDRSDLSGTYVYAENGSPGTFSSDYSSWLGDSAVVPDGVMSYVYINGGSFTIERNGDTYTINGSVQTADGFTAAFSYEGSLTGQLGEP